MFRPTSWRVPTIFRERINDRSVAALDKTCCLGMICRNHRVLNSIIFQRYFVISIFSLPLSRTIRRGQPYRQTTSSYRNFETFNEFAASIALPLTHPLKSSLANTRKLPSSDCGIYTISTPTLSQTETLHVRCKPSSY